MRFGMSYPLLLLMSLALLEGAQDRYKRQCFSSCEVARDSCTAHFSDTDSYPNIAEGFQGYNIILGNLILGQQDNGPQGTVFDEAAERSGAVRFNNIAGHTLNDCAKNFESTYSSNVNEFLESTVATSSSTSSFQLGYEVKITGTLGKEGTGSISAERTIPPLYESLSSNSHSMQDIATKMDAREISVTRTWTQCQVYRYRLQPNSPPSFHSGFQAALTTLGQCWNGHNDTACAKTFINQFGTHFVQKAVFGAKQISTRQFDHEKAETTSRSTVEDCSSKKSEFSLAGSVSFGSSSSSCNGRTDASTALREAGLQKEDVFTIGKGLESWGLGTVPRMIYKDLAPLYDLFQAEFMDGQAINFQAIRPWLENKIVNYCELFKTEHHCNFVVRRNHCPPKRCSLQLPCPGLYTGPVDREFMPHGQGTLTIPSRQDWKITTDWTHGCPGDQQLALNSAGCRWVNGNHWGDIASCGATEVAAGACAGGRSKDCGGRRGGKVVHSLYCCPAKNNPVMVDETTCSTIHSRYGRPVDCLRQGKTVHRSCSSGAHAHCNGQFNRADCCSTRYAVADGRWQGRVASRGARDCMAWQYGRYGVDLVCPHSSVLVARCGSGRHADCPNRSFHGIRCCNLFVR